MIQSNVHFKGLKFNKSVPESYKKIILENPNITKASSDYNIRVHLEDINSKLDNDSWRVLRFKISPKGFFKSLMAYCKCISSAKLSDEEILDKVKKINGNFFKP